MSKYDEIIGHENIKEQLQQAVQLNKVNHAYILSGADGIGKNMVAMAFAEALLCEKQEPCGCGVCHACKQVATGNNPDLKKVLHEKPQVISVDEIREQLVEDIQIKPYNGLYKVYIVDEAEKLNTQAQNAMLKTIEEPPQYGVILLLTNNAELLLPTVRSRCIHYELRPQKDETVMNYLVKNLQIPDYEARVCASFAQGSIGKAMDLAQSEEFGHLKEEMIRFMRNLESCDITDLIAEVKELGNYKADISDFLDLVGVWYRDALLFKITKDPNQVIFSDEINLIRRQSSQSSYEGMENCLKALETAKTRIKANVNFDLAIELLLLNLKEN